MPISRRSPKPSRASLSPKTPSQPHLSLAKNLTRATHSLAGNHTPICASPDQKPNAALALSCSSPSPCHRSTVPHCRRVFSRRKSQAQPRSLYCFQFNSRTNSSWDWILWIGGRAMETKKKRPSCWVEEMSSPVGPGLLATNSDGKYREV